MRKAYQNDFEIKKRSASVQSWPSWQEKWLKPYKRKSLSLVKLHIFATLRQNVKHWQLIFWKLSNKIKLLYKLLLKCAGAPQNYFELSGMCMYVDSIRKLCHCNLCTLCIHIHVHKIKLTMAQWENSPQSNDRIPSKLALKAEAVLSYNQMFRHRLSSTTCHWYVCIFSLW